MNDNPLSQQQRLELTNLKLNLGPWLNKKSATSFVIHITASGSDLWNPHEDANGKNREMELFVQYPPKYPNVSPQLSIKLINGSNSMNHSKLIQIAYDAANQSKLKSKPCILDIVNQLRKHLKQTTTATTTTTTTIPTPINDHKSCGIKQNDKVKNIRKSLRRLRRCQPSQREGTNRKPKARKRRKHRKRKKTQENNSTDENQPTENAENSDVTPVALSMINIVNDRQISQKRIGTIKKKVDYCQRINHDKIDKFWERLDYDINCNISQLVSLKSIIYLQTPLQNNVDNNDRQFVRDCSFVYKLSVQEKLKPIIEVEIPNIKHLEQELMSFTDEIRRFYRHVNSESKYGRKLKNIIERNQAQCDKLNSFANTLLFLKKEIMVNVDSKEKYVILKHFSCITPFHDQIKNIDITTQNMDEIVYYIKCMINYLRLILQDDLPFSTTCDNEDTENDDDDYSCAGRIKWDRGRIKQIEEFNFTAFLCIEYDTMGMCREIANLIAIYAGLSRRDYQLDKAHPTHIQSNTKSDENVCFIQLNGKIKSKISFQNIMDYVKYGYHTPMQSISEIPFDWTQFTQQVWQDLSHKGGTMNCKIDKFCDRLEEEMTFRVSLESIIYLQTPLRKNMNPQYIRDCSLISKLNVKECEKLMRIVEVEIRNIKQLEEELMSFKKIQKFGSKLDYKNEYEQELNGIIERNQTQYDKLHSFLNTLLFLKKQIGERKEKCLILKHFSCMAPFHDEIKNMNIRIQSKNAIVYYTKCMINNLMSQHNLVFLEHNPDQRSFAGRIKWDKDNIKQSKEFNFTRFLCNEYYTMGMCREVANLIAIFAGLSRYDYQLEKEHPTHIQSNTKNDKTVCFIQLNGETDSYISFQNIMDYVKQSNYHTPMQSIYEIPFDCTQFTQQVLQDLSPREDTVNCKIDKFWDRYLPNKTLFRMNIRVIIYLQTPLRKNRNNYYRSRQFIRDCSLISKCSAWECKWLKYKIEDEIPQIQQLQQELMRFKNEIQRVCSQFDIHGQKCDDMIERNQTQYNKLHSFLKTLLCLKRQIVQNVDAKEKWVILKYFSCITPFQNRSKKKEICTTSKNDIVDYTKCMINNLISQHNLPLFKDDTDYGTSSIVEKIKWDRDSIKQSREFNFTRFLCNEYHAMGMCREVANLIAIFAGLSRYDYQLDKEHPTHIQSSTKNDKTVSFVELNGEIRSFIPYQNFIDSNCFAK